MNFKTTPHYRIYYWKHGQLSKFSYIASLYRHYTMEKAMETIKRFMSNPVWREVQFVIVYWESNYKDRIESIVDKNDFPDVEPRPNKNIVP